MDLAGTPPPPRGALAGVADGGPQALTRDYAEKCGDRAARRDRWEALAWLWRASKKQRQRHCRRVATSDLVVVEKRLRAGYSGLQTCGSPWTCPTCGPKIGIERAADAAAGITAHVATGGGVALVTLTMSHTRAQSLAELLAGLGSAWSAIRHLETNRRLLDELTIGWIKSLDLTVGRNGWHPHLHVLFFTRPGVTEEDVIALGHGLFKPWARRLVNLGLAEPTEEHGVDAKLLDLAQAHGQVADYVAGTEYAAAGARGAALELAGTGKVARRGNRTPMGLLADCVRFGLADDVKLYREFETAIARKNRIRWSNGLRQQLIPELGDEATDEDAAASTDGLARLIGYLDRPTWRAVTARPGWPAVLLNWAELYDDDDQARDLIDRQLRRHGLGRLLLPPPPEPDL